MTLEELKVELLRRGDSGTTWGQAVDGEPWHLMKAPITEPLTSVCGGQDERVRAFLLLPEGAPSPSPVCERCLSTHPS